MKIRTSFVSNSSSCSFVIGKTYMNKKQIESFKKWVEDYNNEQHGEGYIHESEYYFYGEIDQHTIDLEKYLKDIGINSKYVSIEE